MTTETKQWIVYALYVIALIYCFVRVYQVGRQDGWKQGYISCVLDEEEGR